MMKLSSVRSLFVGLAAAAALLLAFDAAAALKPSGTPKVAFYAVGSPGFLDIEGKTADLVVADDGTTLVFTVPLANVKTAIELRDDHMKNKYMHIAQYPNVSVTFPKAAVTWPAAVAEGTSGKVTAQFTAHGATVPVEITYSIRKTKTGFAVKGEFPFDVRLHGIEIPSYVGVTVDPMMRAEVVADLVDAP